MELHDAQHGYIESRREHVRLQEELSMKEKVLRDTQIRSMHEMGEMKRAQEPRVDEVSVQKLRENHKTIQKLTSQLQEIQEQMNSMNVFCTQFSTFDPPRDHHQGNHLCAPERERGSVPQAAGSGTLCARHDKQSSDTIPMPTFARRPSTMSSLIPVEFPQNSMVGQQRQQILELNRF